MFDTLYTVHRSQPPSRKRATHTTASSELPLTHLNNHISPNRP